MRLRWRPKTSFHRLCTRQADPPCTPQRKPHCQNRRPRHRNHGLHWAEGLHMPVKTHHWSNPGFWSAVSTHYQQPFILHENRSRVCFAQVCLDPTKFALSRLFKTVSRQKRDMMCQFILRVTKDWWIVSSCKSCIPHKLPPKTPDALTMNQKSRSLFNCLIIFGNTITHPRNTEAPCSRQIVAIHLPPGLVYKVAAMRWHSCAFCMTFKEKRHGDFSASKPNENGSKIGNQGWETPLGAIMGCRGKFRSREQRRAMLSRTWREGAPCKVVVTHSSGNHGSSARMSEAFWHWATAAWLQHPKSRDWDHHEFQWGASQRLGWKSTSNMWAACKQILG